MPLRLNYIYKYLGYKLWLLSNKIIPIYPIYSNLSSAPWQSIFVQVPCMSSFLFPGAQSPAHGYNTESLLFSYVPPSIFCLSYRLIISNWQVLYPYSTQRFSLHSRFSKFSYFRIYFTCGLAQMEGRCLCAALSSELKQSTQEECY